LLQKRTNTYLQNRALPNFEYRRPNAEHLFSHSWNENCYFYGNGDAFMVGPPPSSRERCLLKLHESTVRGQSYPQVDPTAEQADDESHGDFEPPELPEEELFLPNIVPPCFSSLPSLLEHSTGSETAGSIASDVQACLLQKRQRERVEEGLDLLYDYVFRFYYSRLFVRGLGRVQDPFLSNVATANEGADPRLFLDYLPMLRVMMVHEKTAQHLFDLAAESPSTTTEAGTAEVLSHRARVTRGSAKMGREHYLEKISPYVEWGKDDCDSDGVDANLRGGEKSTRQVGHELAARCLLYCNSP